MKTLLNTLIAVALSNLVLAQTTTENYVKTTSPQTPVQTEAALNNLSTDHKQETITYFDGLGRPKQQIGIRQSPTGKDIITHIGYDPFGRQDKSYLPYVPNAAGGEGLFRTGNQAQATTTFYNTSKYENTQNPYSETHFEASPLNRVLEQGAPGADWALDKESDSDHSIKFDYQTNATSEVISFSVSHPNNNTENIQLEYNDFYATNELYKTITKDENWTLASANNHTTEEFKNKQGQVILKRTYNTNDPYDTYYVYDDFGNLTYVLPPKASSQDLTILSNTTPENLTSSAVITSSNTLGLTATNSITLQPGFHAQQGSNFSATITDDTLSATNLLDNLCYQYKYDGRNRLIEKKIPGKGWEYIVYDKLDRPVLTQDPNLKTTNDWLLTKYDVFGRVAYTGIRNIDISRSDLQTLANDGDYTQYESKISINTLAGTPIYYSSSAIPTAVTKVYTINYYDTYEDVPTDLIAPTTVLGQAVTLQTKSLPTVNKVRVLGTSSWITSVTYYDAKARPIYMYSKNPI